MVADSRETVLSRHNKTGAGVNSQRLAACIRPPQAQTRQNPNMENGRWASSTPKMLFFFFHEEDRTGVSLSPRKRDFSQQPGGPMGPHALKVVPRREQSMCMRTEGYGDHTVAGP